MRILAWLHGVTAQSRRLLRSWRGLQTLTLELGPRHDLSQSQRQKMRLASMLRHLAIVVFDEGGSSMVEHLVRWAAQPWTQEELSYRFPSPTATKGSWEGEAAEAMVDARCVHLQRQRQWLEERQSGGITAPCAALRTIKFANVDMEPHVLDAIRQSTADVQYRTRRPAIKQAMKRIR